MKIFVAASVAAIAAAIVTSAIAAAPAAPQVTRKVLLTQDLASAGGQVVEIMVEIPAGGREGKHTHPGALVVYVQEGNLTLDYEGKPTVTYKPGETFFIETGKVHEGINNGTTGVKAIATYVGVKGQPLASPVP
ncbi:MAG: cupin domain-containing protein [Alphaproteobacteria bacterium]|nr:cupin domain-containing protein [Alphaproteobacteria bacterium]